MAPTDETISHTEALDRVSFSLQGHRWLPNPDKLFASEADLEERSLPMMVVFI